MNTKGVRLMNKSLIAGAAVIGAMSAMGVICLVKKKEAIKKDFTLYEARLAQFGKKSAKGLKGKLSIVVNKGVDKLVESVNKLKVIADAWEAENNGIATAFEPLTDFEVACEGGKIVEDEIEKPEDIFESEKVQGMFSENSENFIDKAERSLDDIVKTLDEVIETLSDSAEIDDSIKAEQ